MGQVVKFFGWLILAVGGTLVVFGHLMQGFVYGWDRLWWQLTSDPLTTALYLLAFAPGALLYGFGVLIEYLGRRSDEKWEAKKAAAQAAAKKTPDLSQTES